MYKRQHTHAATHTHTHSHTHAATHTHTHTHTHAATHAHTRVVERRIQPRFQETKNKRCKSCVAYPHVSFASGPTIKTDLPGVSCVGEESQIVWQFRTKYFTYTPPGHGSLMQPAHKTRSHNEPDSGYSHKHDISL